MFRMMSKRCVINDQRYSPWSSCHVVNIIRTRVITWTDNCAAKKEKVKTIKMSVLSIPDLTVK